MVSEKRFRKLQGYMADNNRKYDNGDVYAMDFTEVEDMLNALHEENEQLRKQLDFYLLDEFEWKEKYGDVLDE